MRETDARRVVAPGATDTSGGANKAQEQPIVIGDLETILAAVVAETSSHSSSITTM